MKSDLIVRAGILSREYELNCANVHTAELVAMQQELNDLGDAHTAVTKKYLEVFTEYLKGDLI
jgi:hypothetical protein